MGAQGDTESMRASKKITAVLSSFILSILPFLILWAAWSVLPDTIPAHWSGGVVDRWGRLTCRSVGPAENGEEISLLNERMLQAALQGALGVGIKQKAVSSYLYFANDAHSAIARPIARPTAAIFA